MKKIVLLGLMAIVCFAYTLNANTKYKITLKIRTTYVYYDENDAKIGTKTESPIQTIYNCSDTEYTSRNAAINEWSRMCSSTYDYRKDEGETGM